jgi:hypothetical protein
VTTITRYFDESAAVLFPGRNMEGFFLNAINFW